MLDCPVCHREQHVVCGDKECICFTSIPSGELPQIDLHGGEVVRCPYCGFTAHADFWFVRSMELAQIESDSRARYRKAPSRRSSIGRASRS